MKRIYSKMKRQDRAMPQREKKGSERCREKASVVEVE